MTKPDNREGLAKYLGQRVACVGEYRQGDAGYRSVIVEDITVTGDDGGRAMVDHTHVQKAGELLTCGAKPLDRVSFTATVHQYEGRDGQARYGLGMPRDVEVTRDTPPARTLWDVRLATKAAATPPVPAPAPVVVEPALPPAAEVPPVQPARPSGGHVAALRAAKRLVAEYGPDGAVKVLLSLDELNRVAGEFGGGELAEMIEVLAG